MEVRVNPSHYRAHAATKQHSVCETCQRWPGNSTNNTHLSRVPPTLLREKKSTALWLSLLFRWHQFFFVPFIWIFQLEMWLGVQKRNIGCLKCCIMEKSTLWPTFKYPCAWAITSVGQLEPVFRQKSPISTHTLLFVKGQARMICRIFFYSNKRI